MFDSGYDPLGTCEDLSTAIQLAQVSLGCAFLPPQGMAGDCFRCIRRFKADPTARQLRLRVQYFQRDDVAREAAVPVKEATLLYLKSRMTPEDGDLQSTGNTSAWRDPFPHHPTSNQFFSPELFARYSELGRRAGVVAAESYTSIAAAGWVAC